MRSIVVGLGKVGQIITKYLADEGHDVIVIDKNFNKVEEVVDNYDVMGINGNGANNDVLKEELSNVISGRTDIFYVDCFKGLSRNFEKILHVLQIILQSGKAFVTCNYYISDGRIEKRRRILRAFHSQKDMFDNVRNLKGLPPFFKSVLKELI